MHFVPVLNFHQGTKLVDLLTQEYTSIVYEVKNQFANSNSKAVGTSSDGWSTISNLPVHNLMVCNPMPLFFRNQTVDKSKDSASNLYQLYQETLTGFKQEILTPLPRGDRFCIQLLDTERDQNPVQFGRLFGLF
jgi:hypothetical protein